MQITAFLLSMLAKKATQEAFFLDNSKIIALKESEIIENIKAERIFIFLIIDIGLISIYLSLKIKQDLEKKIIKLSQPTYIDKVFAKFYFDKGYFINILMKEIALFQPKTDEKAFISKKK